MKEGVQEAFTSGRLKELARFWSMFHRYSFGNILLIWTQKPQASLVAGIKTWNKAGRRVKKGEKGIKILAPKTYKKTVVDQETGVETEEVRLAGFQVVTVFDVTQTEGKPLPIEKKLADTRVGQNLFKCAVDACPVPVVFDDITGAAKGYYAPKERRIVLSSGLEGDEKVAVLLHEIAHHIAHEIGEQKLSKSRADEEYIKGEIVAEGAAFIACTYFGVDSGSLAFDYVASWAGNPEKVIRWGEAVQKVAQGLIDLIEKSQKREFAA
ncbi:Antirestriction protein ArdC [Desulfoscipio geothermicus DSM 3669]|uniref:Antirestriction protein ArdC n=1 Tax=Desulfoscipio geothermicus DSM 3669 TaxID=1121426 RepID=A0A1I6E442_9FIRM|nr:Antirestriction protein ArdC [Desulfoscipio geothermicus DSM 3669]